MPVWENVDDIQLVKLAQNGEPEAFGVLYERYAKMIFRYINAHAYDRLDAEDLTEEVFYRVLRSLPNYREQGVPFAAFLYHVARNVLIDHHRRSKFFSKDVQLGDGQLMNQLSGKESSEDGFRYQELRQMLVQLRDDYRDVLIFRFISDLTPEETAQLMDRSVGAIRVLQHRALAALRKILVRDNGSSKVE